MDVIAEGLAFPEGPVVLEDGSVIVVEVMGGRITRCWDSRKETVCDIGGGPNGAAIGPDGALWVCNNGGMAPGQPRTPGRIERVDLSNGSFERIYEACGDKMLHGPNDLVFDSSGRMWFTDFGKQEGDVRRVGALYTCLPDGSEITPVYERPVAYNGVGLSPDERHVYVADTAQARIYRFDNQPGAQEPQYVATAMGPVGFDSLAVTAAGNVCVATLFEGGVTTITPDGDVSVLPIAEDPYVTNIAFGGDDMRDAYLTLSGTGQLVRVRWNEPGLKLAFNA